MGADIYLRWVGMSDEDKHKQYTGFDITKGKMGYLRGSYNGHIGLKAIRQLFEGVNWDKDWVVDIKLLKGNLEELEKGLFKKSKGKFYSEGNKDLEIQSYRDFVALAEELVKAGKKPKVSFSY